MKNIKINPFLSSSVFSVSSLCSLTDQPVEDGVVSLAESSWGVKLHHLPSSHHQDPVAVHDGVDPVCNSEDGLVLKLLSDGLLQQFVRLLVHAGCGFINTQDLGLGQQSSGQTQQLSLSHRERFSSLPNLSIQTTHPADHRAEVALVHHVQQLLVSVSPTRVQILPDGPAEQEGVLGNNGQPRPELSQAHSADVQPVQENLTLVQLHHTEQGQEQGGLSRACTSHNAHLLPRSHHQAHPIQGVRKTVPVGQNHAAKLQPALFGPRWGQLCVLVLWLSGKAGGVLLGSLHTHQLHLRLGEAEYDAAQQGCDGQGVGQGQTHQTRIDRVILVLDDSNHGKAGHHSNANQLQADAQPLAGGVAKEQAALVLLQTLGDLLFKPGTR